MLAVVLKSNRHLLGIRDDVIIGDDITAGIDDEPGTECKRLFLSISVRVRKKAPQELIERGSAWHGGPETAAPLGIPLLPCGRLFRQLDRDIDDRRQHVLGQRRKAWQGYRSFGL